MAYVSYTEEEYYALRAAYVQGVREVKYGDKKVTYNSMREMKAVLNEMERELFPDRFKNRTVGIYNSTK